MLMQLSSYSRRPFTPRLFSIHPLGGPGLPVYKGASLFLGSLDGDCF